MAPHPVHFANEVKTLIFAALPNMRSVLYLSLTSKEWYNCMRADERTIVCQVLRREIQPLEVAIAVQAAEKELLLEPQDLEDFLQRKPRTEEFMKDCDLKKAGRLSEFHGVVTGLASRMASKLLAQASMHLKDALEIEPSPSRTEMTRMEKTFYRMELFRHCVRHVDPSTLRGYETDFDQIFWQHFQYHELDQMIIASEFLCQTLRPVYTALALSNPRWCSRILILMNDMGESHDLLLPTEFTQGLKRIYTLIVNAEQDPTCTRTLMPLPRAYDKRKTLGFSLASILGWHTDGDIKDSGCLSGEADEGPQNASSWLLEGPRIFVEPADEDPQISAPPISIFTVMAIGYVFWDRKRLERWNLFTMECCSTSCGHYDFPHYPRPANQSDFDFEERMLAALKHWVPTARAPRDENEKRVLAFFEDLIKSMESRASERQADANLASEPEFYRDTKGCHWPFCRRSPQARG